MARQLTAVVLTVLLVGAALGVGLGGATAQTAGNEQATISVSGDGEVAAQPDEAVVFVSVTATAENASEAAAQVAANVSQLETALNDSNLTSEVQTTDYSIRRESPRDRPGPPGRDDDEGVTYVARQSFAVTVPNVTDAGAVIDVSVANGANEVGGVQFTLSEDRREELREEAIRRAVADARLQAEAVAAATDLRVGSIRTVSVGGATVFTERLAFGAASRDTVIQPREVTVSASVQITYNATAG